MFEFEIKISMNPVFYMKCILDYTSFDKQYSNNDLYYF